MRKILAFIILLLSFSRLPALAQAEIGFKTVSASNCFAMALRADGTVWAWGDNTHGNLGDGTKNSRYAPVRVKGLTNVADIDAGINASYAIRQDGTLWGWGSNEYLQLGYDGPSTTTPRQVANLSGIIAVSTYSQHTIALKKDGTVWTWGNNAHGQLGYGTVSGYTPKQVIRFSSVVSVAAGDDHSIVAESDGSVWIWGHGNPVPLHVLDGAAKVVAGYDVSFAIKKDQSIWCIKPKYEGGYYVYLYTTMPVKAASTADNVSDNNNAFITIDGNAWTWKSTESNPKQVQGLNDVIRITSGGSFFVALTSDGKLWSWGKNGVGQLGIGHNGIRTTPAQIPGLTEITSIATDTYASSYAVNKNGEIFTWGTHSHTASKIDGLTGKCVAAGASTSYNNGHVLALKEDGTVWGRGDSQHCQLGIVLANGSGPVRVGTLTGIKYIAASTTSSAAVAADGKLWAWGVIIPTLMVKPPLIIPIDHCKQVELASRFLVALKDDGTVWFCGSYGDLSISRTAPIQIPGLAGITAISTKSNDSRVMNMALKEDGTVWTWSWRTDHVNPWRSEFVVKQVAGIEGVIAISAGGDHYLALRDDGTVWAWGSEYQGDWSWGSNDQGELGDGSWIDRDHPVQVKDLTGVTAIAAGIDYSLALKNDGTVWGWGSFKQYQMGDGKSEQEITPQPVSPVSTSDNAPYLVGATVSSPTLRVGSWSTVTCTYAHNDGARELSQCSLLINNALSNSGGAHFIFDPVERKFYMKNNSGATLPTNTVIESDNAFLDTSQTTRTITGNGNASTIAWRIMPKPAMLNKDCIIYTKAMDHYDLTAGWSAQGGIKVTNNRAPSLGNATPSAGNIAIDRWTTISSVYYDPDGSNTLATVSLLINKTLTNSGGAHFFYDLAAQKFGMKDDYGVPVLQSTNSPSFVETRNAVIDCSSTKLYHYGSMLTVNWRVKFKSVMAGKTCNIYMMAKDDAGAATAWTQKGRLAITAQSAPTLGTIALTYSTLVKNEWSTIISHYSDLDGAADIASCNLLINKTLTNSGGAHFIYDQVKNKFFMKNNLGVVIPTAGITPGTTATIESENGILDCKGSTITQEGDTLTVKWRVRLKTNLSFEVSNLYETVIDKAGAYVPWKLISQFGNIASASNVASLSNSYSSEMLRVPAGDFMMSNNASAELPKHLVYLSDYQISKDNISRSDFAKFINDGGYSNKEYWSPEGWNWKTSSNVALPTISSDNEPLTGVSYYEAEAFCNWAGGHLPTEAQWEKAAGLFGSEDNSLWNWCRDWHSDTYLSEIPADGWVDPQGPESSDAGWRVLRSIDSRCGRDPGDVDSRIGFRLAR